MLIITFPGFKGINHLVKPIVQIGKKELLIQPLQNKLLISHISASIVLALLWFQVSISALSL